MLLYDKKVLNLFKSECIVTFYRKQHFISATNIRTIVQVVILGICLDREQPHCEFSTPKRSIFLHSCVTCSELPSNYNKRDM